MELVYLYDGNHNQSTLNLFEMFNSMLFVVIILTVCIMAFFWYAKYASKSGFAVDENKNDIPDSWEEKFGILFKFKHIIILLLGIAIGYLFGLSTF